MTTTFRQRRLLYGLSASLVGFVLVLVTVLGPLSFYRCRTMGGAVSVQQHECCASKRGTSTVKGERSICCEQIKAASPQVPTLVQHLSPQLEPHWTPAPALLFAQPAFEFSRVVAVPRSERGPPLRHRTPPVFLLNASLLC